MNGYSEQWAALPPYLGAHIQLTLAALAIGLAFSLPIGVWASRHPRLERGVLAVASVLQTIPGLALLALMVAFLGGLNAWLESQGLAGVSSIGFLPAVVALSLYSVLPMLRNIVTGLAEVDPALREAALGVGMTERERLFQVELPLALPTVIAGIRTATVWVVGTATLATPVGAPSLGNPIFAGLQTRHLPAVVVGSIAAAGLAIALDALIRGVEVALQRRSRPRLVMSLVGLLAIFGLGISWTTTEGIAEGEREIVIGSKSFTEQYVLADLLERITLEEPATHVRRVPSLGSIVAFDGLVAGEIDLYVDYTGTIWATIFKLDTVGTKREQVLDEVRRRLPDEYGVHVVAALGFENTYALAMRANEARSLGIRRISDLVAHAGQLSIASDYEFFQRAEWQALESVYGLAFREERGMDAALMYEAAQSGSIDVIGAYSTDGRIAAYDLVVLEDDRRVIPPYDAIVVASRRLVDEAPALARRIGQLEGQIDADTMRQMNSAVDFEGLAPSAVAGTWWAEHERVGRRAPTPSDRESNPDARRGASASVREEPAP